jgi:hypothetical protein
LTRVETKGNHTGRRARGGPKPKGCRMHAASTDARRLSPLTGSNLPCVRPGRIDRWIGRLSSGEEGKAMPAARAVCLCVRLLAPRQNSLRASSWWCTSCRCRASSGSRAILSRHPLLSQGPPARGHTALARATGRASRAAAKSLLLFIGGHV